MKTKICIKCLKEKTLYEFVKDKSRKSGIRNYCKECENLRRRKTSIKPKAKEGFKICAKCKKELELSRFNLRTINGKKVHFSYCKQCEKKYDNNRYEHICPECGKKYKSGRKDSIKCKECHTKLISKKGKELFNKINSNQFGKNNVMYGVKRFGKDNPNYNPNKTDEEREKGRLILGYELWRHDVFKKDNYICSFCGDKKGHNLNAHHLDGWNWCKEKRTDINNGVTLCNDCHKKFHDKYGYGNNTKEQFYEFVRQFSNNKLIPR